MQNSDERNEVKRHPDGSFSKSEGRGGVEEGAAAGERERDRCSEAGITEVDGAAHHTQTVAETIEAVGATDKSSDHSSDGYAIDDNFDRNSFVYSVMIRLLGRARRMDKVEELLERMRQHGVAPNAVVLNCLMDAYGHAGRVEEAERVFQELEGMGRVGEREYW